MATLSRRVQVLLSSEQYRRLEGLADAEGISVGALIRRAIDRLQGTPPPNQTVESGSADRRHVASGRGLGTDGAGVHGVP